MTIKELQTSKKSFERRREQRVESAIEYAKAGTYSVAIDALTEAQAYDAIVREYEYIIEVMEVENA